MEVLLKSISACDLVFYDHAHRASGAGDDFDSAIHVDSVELAHLDLRDVLKIGARNLADFIEIRFAGAFFDFDLFADQIVDWLAETNPIKSPVFVDLDVDNDVFAVVFLGGLIEGVNELHHVETPLAERRADWRSSGSLAARDAQLQVADDFSCHSYFLFFRAKLPGRLINRA